MNFRPPAPAGSAARARRGEAFARDWSLEATRPTAAELATLVGVLRPGAPIYLSAIAGRPHAELVAAATAVRAAGFEPVPHVAARGYASLAELEDILDRLTGQAQVRRILLLGGEVDRPGAFADALAVLESGALIGRGITDIGIAGYPDGHPRIDTDTLARALAAKVEAAQRASLRTHIVTQFCFEPDRIIAWLAGLRQAGIAAPVQVGVIGPTSLPTLLRFAQRCGVRASARGLMRTGFARARVGDTSPAALLQALLHTDAEIGDIAPHFFSFGGVLRTARYGRDAADTDFAPHARGRDGVLADAPRA